MLEKNVKNCYFDAHFHYFDCIKRNSFDYLDFFNEKSDDEWKGCSCALNIEEWNNQIEGKKLYNNNIFCAFGIHPQNSWDDDVLENLSFLEKLVTEKKLTAIGEIGFDFYDERFCNHKTEQEKIWNIQLELAIKNNLSVIIHSRKANEKLFEYSDKLKKLPSVLFHSFMGNSQEALSLCRRGINAYFSFGKQLLNNNKKSIDCVKNLPLETLLCETDAPFQKLKNQEKTYISEIKQVYNTAFLLRNDCKIFSDFQKQLETNFNNLFVN